MIQKILDFRLQEQKTPVRTSCSHSYVQTRGIGAQILFTLLVLALLAGQSGAEVTGEGPASCMVLVTSTEGGSVNPFGATTVPSGSDITFTITPQPGYEIDHVMVDQIDKGSIPTLTISPVIHDIAVHIIFGPVSQTTVHSPEPAVTPCTVQTIPQPTPYRGTEKPEPVQQPSQKQESISQVITVGRTGADFTRIQDAIESASPGKIIQIDPGTYEEQVIITKPLTLTGKKGEEKPLISAGENGSALLITASQVNLNRLQITDAKNDGNDLIAAVSGTGIRDLALEECEFSKSQNGLIVSGSENITITACNITNISRNGISLTTTNDIRIIQTRISECKTDLIGENLTRLFIQKTQINDAEERGVFFDGIADSEIRGNIIAGNSKALPDTSPSPGDALRLDSARNVTITENQIVSNLGVGFRLDKPARITVTNNTLRNNAAGFSCTGDIRESNTIDQSNIIDGLPILYYQGISGKTIEGLSPATLYLVNCSDITVRNIAMASRNGYGIVAEGGRNLAIQNISVGRNLNQNILITGVTGGTIAETTVHNSSRYGLGISDSSSMRIAGSEFRDNAIGVAIRGISTGVNLSGNSFSGDLIGVQIQEGFSSSGFGELAGNRINRCITGVVSSGGGAGMIRQNQIKEVSEGLNLSGSQDLNVEENQIEAYNTGLSLAQGSLHPSAITKSRASFGNRVVRNSITAGKPLQILDSSEWIYGNTFVLNDFNSKTATTGSTGLSPQASGIDLEDSWGGFTPATLDLSESGKSKQAEQVETSNTWDTGERVRYIYGNSTFSGFLGNHWTSYKGKEIAASGVGDTPYTINSDNIDKYPLTGLQNQYQTEGGGYPLDLKAGWNLISTPSDLASGHNTAQIFSDVDSGGHSMYSFANGSWTVVKADDIIQPLYGFWIYAADATTVPLIFDPGTVPTPVHLVKGWNVIGFPGIQTSTAGDALHSLDKSWSYVMGYNATSQKYDPPIFRDGGLTAIMYPSRGYWIHLDQETDLEPVTG
ncbi:MAG TPA: right-handed parallel beta-helix repeat-containing protein [Methanospirillum sp.]|uniref:right-handed parallel beta-helix repeat-containing protein n=1 Tax=Methanospirillum sp. TaxID=45200 RepID=UPI002C0433DC|nr:right-handed parallel beta-helix repeat-containing protein [Methanospirillum sp.]HWQ65097.1 right-handed parallel beta-helix repeat-containing protein [Methanospirillum sp.]